MPDALADFFLNSDSDIIQYDTLEIQHPDFSKFYRLVRNNVRGLTANHEDGFPLFFAYYPLRIDGAGARSDLDYAITITFGDLGEVLPQELENVYRKDGFAVKPIIRYRAYRSDDLSEPMFGPIELEIGTISFDSTGCKFEAKAPELNINATGEVYRFDRFPMMRGIL